MNPRHMLMTGALAVAAWLAFVADKTPSADSTAPVAAADRSLVTPPPCAPGARGRCGLGGQPATAASIFAARSRSSCVIPPAECVLSVNDTFVYRMSMSG